MIAAVEEPETRTRRRSERRPTPAAAGTVAPEAVAPTPPVSRCHARPLLLGCTARPGQVVRREAAQALARLVAPDDHWRLFPELSGAALYLDIETTGLDEDDAITVVGLSDGRRARALVQGRDLTGRALGRALRQARLLVSWNGLAFDLPRLRRRFPGLPWDLPHLDLAVCSRRLGLPGALKGAERVLGRRRPAALEGIDGAEAARLWRRHEAGVRGAARLLADYCRQDVVSLVELAPLLQARMQRRFGAASLLLPSA